MSDTIWIDVEGRDERDLPSDTSIILKLKPERPPQRYSLGCSNGRTQTLPVCSGHCHIARQEVSIPCGALRASLGLFAIPCDGMPLDVPAAVPVSPGACIV